MYRNNNHGTDYWAQPAKVVPITIKLLAGVTSYELPDKSILNNCSHWIGIGHRSPAGNRKTRSGADIINENCFKAAHLTLRSETDEDFLREVPLELLELKSGDNFFFRLPNIPFDIANSKIKIADASTIVANQEIELLIFYAPQ